MSKGLVIVESPGKAKAIQKYLGKGYVVEASLGHVKDLPKSTLGVDIDNNFETEYVVIPGKEKVLAKLKKLALSADNIYLAPDPTAKAKPSRGTWPRNWATETRRRKRRRRMATSPTASAA